MKRFLLPLLLLLLTACSPQSLSGQVTEVITGPDGTLTALVIETDAHEERGLLSTFLTWTAFPRIYCLPMSCRS